MERSCKKLKITPILFNNGESLLSEFISFCPPIVRIKLFELYPTELMIIEEFDEIFKYNDIYYSFFGKKAYIGAQEATTEDLWFEFNQYEYGTRKPTSLREISNCFGQKFGSASLETVTVVTERKEIPLRNFILNPAQYWLLKNQFERIYL